MLDVYEQEREVGGRSADETIDLITNRSNEIASMISFITDLSSQTNLLAVNTNIQAAKFGVNGQGFRVISNELRKLSEQSKISLEKIEHLLHALSQDASQLRTAKEENETITRALGRIENQNELFNLIINEIEDKIEVKDDKLQYYMINKAGLADYGVPREDIIGKTMFDFFPKEIAQNYSDIELNIIKNRSVKYSLEEVILNDSHKYLFINKTAIFLPEKDQWGLLVIQREFSQADFEKADFIENLKNRYENLSIQIGKSFSSKSHPN